MIAACIAAVLVIAAAAWAVSVYNSLVRGLNKVREAWSGISVQLKRRHDLVPSLVNTVKGYAAHESSTLEQVTAARARAVSAEGGDVGGVSAAEHELGSALRSLLAVAERYPELKANANFLDLQSNLSTLENDIQMARRYYNGSVREQNDRVGQFPTNLVAGCFGFGEQPFFELENEDESRPPAVSF
ncbi:MAG: LemA family protein [Mailhella sp.]|nr:LemA family protein [Mailhella sp.]